MKKIVMVGAFACALTTGAAQAGSMSDPIVEQDLIATEAAASSSSGTALVALLALTLMIPLID